MKRLLALGFVCATLHSGFAAEPTPPTVSTTTPRPLILDMVHHNPGEALYESQYEDPHFVRQTGFNGKVYFLFDSPTIAVNWESADPDIFPPGSEGRKWVDAKAARIDAQHAACKAAGINTFAMGDMILFPKELIRKYHLEKTFGDASNPETQKWLRVLVAQVFDRFPNLDGLVVRIGETYLHDAPFHLGSIQNKSSAEKTIVPLINLLREEICVKRGKTLIFRTWLSWDKDLKTYLAVSGGVEPHPNLVFSIKHCEDDFHRGNHFSKILGQGRHQQIVEVQCAREYEGKGAYPNYIGQGVIDGFEEHLLQMPPTRIRSIGEWATKSGLYAGVWTWSRGGGWRGPYIKNELWCDLNTWVMAQWAANPSQSEETIFRRYATEKLGLKGSDVDRFRQLCLLSAQAVLRGKTSTHSDISPWWSRDDGIHWPKLPADPTARQRVVAQKTEAVQMWETIVGLADEIQFPDPGTADFVRVSSRYGLGLYRIYQAIFEIAQLDPAGDPAPIRKWLQAYDLAWQDFRKLPATSPQCATLYNDTSNGYGGMGPKLQPSLAPYRTAAGQPTTKQSTQAP